MLRYLSRFLSGGATCGLDRQRSRFVVLVGLVGISISGCTSSAGVPEFRVYADAFDASQQASASILDELAVVERTVAAQTFARGKFLKAPIDTTAIEERRGLAGVVEGLGFDPNFYIEDARWISDFGDPPFTSSYRRALNVVADFNNVVIAYAEGRALDEIKAEAATLGAQAGQLLTLLGRLETAGDLAPPGVGTAVKAIAAAVDLGLQAKSREAFRTAVIQEQPRIDRILEEVQNRAPSIFTLVTADHQDTASRAEDPATREEAIQTIETYRSIFSNWVVLLADARATLGGAVAAIGAPRSELALLRDVNAGAVDLRVRSEMIHALLLELRQPG